MCDEKRRFGELSNQNHGESIFTKLPLKNVCFPSEFPDRY
jgi:hypothetical protein